MRQPLSRQAELGLRQYILENGLRPGDPLPPEAELAGLLDMGKTSIREGVRRLETLGIVNVKHGQGLFVGGFSFAPLIDLLPYSLAYDTVPFRDLLQARRALEEGLVVEASKRLSEANLVALEAIVDQMAHRAGPHGTIPADLDRAFHHQLFEPLGNAFVTQLIDVFWQIFDRASAQLPQQRDHHTAEEHAQILRAIRSGDPTAMTRAVAHHFADIEKVLEEMAASGTEPRHATRGTL